MIASMFVRTVKNEKGQIYLLIVENTWEDGKTKQKVLFNMGRLDLLQATGQIDRITQALERFCLKTRLVDLSKDISVDESFVYGSVYCLKALFGRTPLQAIVDEIALSHPQLEIPFADAVFTLVVSRFVHPCSKLALREKWMERFYLELVRQEIALHQIYRTLDLLFTHKDEIQKKAPLSQLPAFVVCLTKIGTGILRYDNPSIRERERRFRRTSSLRLQQGET